MMGRIYCRLEPTKDSATRDMIKAHQRPLWWMDKFKDVVCYSDKKCKQHVATFGWFSKKRPRPNSKKVTLNCADYWVCWVEPKLSPYDVAAQFIKEFDHDEEINGGDAVDRIFQYIIEFKKSLKP